LQVLSIRPEPPGFGSTIARFDVALSDDLRLFNLRLSKRASGGYAVFSPNALGRRVATFSQPLVDKIASAALAALLEPSPHDRTAD
jgi:hypothetical protein